MAAHAGAGYGTTLLVVTWVQAAIASLLLLARTYTTCRLTRHIRSDLYLALLTFIVAGASVIFLTVSIDYGLGAHIHVLSQEEIIETIKWSWVNLALAILAIALGKLAIVAFLQGIHGPEDCRRVILLWGVAISNLIINAITIGMFYTQCTPRAKLWNAELPGRCDGRLRNQRAAYFQGSWSAFCDLILALYPVVFFWKVRLNTRVKVGLCVLMGLGGIACVCSIVKTTYLRVLSQTEDVTYYIAELITWNETEKWVVLIVGCIPPIRPLLMVFFRKILTTARSTTGRSNCHGKLAELQFYSPGTNPPERARNATEVGSSLGDQDSGENILALEDGTIMKTTDISLSYEGRPAPRAGGAQRTDMIEQNANSIH